MKVIAKIFGGIALGMVVSVILGTMIFQAILFQLGADYLGVGPAGITYFLGGFIASLVLMFYPGAKAQKKFIGLYPVAVVMVGAVAGMGLLKDSTGYVPSGDQIAAMEHTIGQFVVAIAQGVFWCVPVVVTGLYGYLYWSENYE